MSYIFFYKKRVKPIFKSQARKCFFLLALLTRHSDVEIVFGGVKIAIGGKIEKARMPNEIICYFCKKLWLL
jgi:hypothetical protein